MAELYRVTIALTWRRQIVLVLLSLAVAALAPVPLIYQREIINGLDMAGAGFDTDMLLALGAQLAAVILLSLALKWLLGQLSGTLGEGLIRTIRARLTRDYAGRRGAEVERGTVVTAMSAEAEALGKFAGNALAEPLLQLGTLVSVIGFIAATQPRLGLLALAIVVPQALIVLFLQGRINRLVGERVRLLRRATDAVARAEAGAVERSILDDFDAIYATRRRIFVFKLSTKFLLSAINGAGMVGVLMLGGWLVIEGRSDVGTVVAALTGLARIGQPWRQMIAFYRSASAVQVKYGLLAELLDSLAADGSGRAAIPGRRA
jgi:ABC-type multidrug transport system fused ATPase/permease subunit